MAETASVEPRGSRGAAVVLLSVMVVASVSGLVYELLAGALSSYLLGSSITQFSLVVGVFLSAMGVGSYASQHVRGSLEAAFVAVEMAVGLIGGLVGLIGFAAFAWTDLYRPVLFGSIFVVGALIGLEVPLVVRILQRRTELRVSVANVLSADYLGALAGSLLFPFVLVPEAGLVRGGLLAGVANVAGAWIALWVLRPGIRRVGPLVAFGAVATLTLLSALVFAEPIARMLERDLYQDEVIYSADSEFQHLTITRWRDDIRLYLDGNLQFASVDEYRYHESLVHPAMGLVPRARRVLVLGGGDGLAAREILKWPHVEEVRIVDLDPMVTELFRTRPVLAALNGGSLSDPRVTVDNDDAMTWLEREAGAFDVIIADLPDPNNLSVGKLYTRQFYRVLLKRLSRSGVFVTQATSPFATRSAFWCIVRTLAAAKAPIDLDVNVAPYWAHVPSFGEWGFVLAAPRRLDPSTIDLPIETRYLTRDLLPRQFAFGKDTGPVDGPINDLDDQPLVRLYEQGYERFYD